MKLEQRIRQADLNGLFSQRINYEKHKKKLEELSNRKSYLIKSDRLNQLEAIKVRKHHSFLKELIERNNNIGRDNTKMLDRLTNVRESVPVPVPVGDEGEARKRLSPFKKRQQARDQQENNRLSLRLRSLVSSINSKQIELDYERNSQIRSRISRYQSNELSQRKLPKSQKFIKLSLSKSINSVKSAKSMRDDDKKELSTSAHTNAARIRPLRNRIVSSNQQQMNQTSKQVTDPVKSSEIKPKIGSFYQKEEIMKNRVTQNSYAFSHRQRISMRGRREVQHQRSRSKSQDHDLNKLNNFFPTELPKNSAER